jgi:uncharacterized repeat protein (TIGR01451 family)
MADYSATIKLLKRISTILLIAAAAGVLSALMLAPLVRADSPIFVRPGGDDLFCDGTVNQDYNPVTGPACAVKTFHRAIELAGPDGQIMLFTGQETIPVLLGGQAGGDIIVAATPATTLTVTKNDFPDPVNPVGSLLTYTITISNIGPAATSQVFLNDTLPLIGIVAFKSALPSQGTCGTLAPWIISCTLGALNVGTNAVVTMVVTTTAAGPINNVVVVSSPDALTTFDSEDTQVIGSTDLSLSKSDFPDPVVVGTALTYTLVVSNSGPTAAATAQLTDTLPASVLTGSFPPGCTYSAPTLTCNLGFLAVNSSTTISFVVTPTVVGVITNTAGITVSGGASDPIPGNNLATQTTRVVAPTNLIITKTAALTWVVPGQTVTYTIQYSNTSNYTATGVVISDVLPAFTTFGSDNSGLPTVGSGSGPISWTRGTLPAHMGGTFVLTTSLSSGATCNSFITNTAYIDSAGGELDTSDNVDTATLQILCGVNLVVVKNDGVGTGDPRPNVTAGDYITYTISVNNMGNQLAANVVLSETLPANTIFDAARSTLGWTAAGGGVYTISLGNLSGNGGGNVVLFVVRVDPNLACTITQTVNTAVANSNGPEIYPPDNTSNEQTPIVCGPSGQLQLRKDDGVICAIPGQLIDYTITVTNAAVTPVNNLVLTEFLPANTSFQGPVATWTPGVGNTYTHNIASLNGGQVNNTGFSVQVVTSTTATAITNVVTLAPGGLSFVLTTPIAVNTPDLYTIKNDNIELLSAATAETIARLEKQLGPLPWLEAVKGQELNAQATSAAPGDVISYTIAFGNAGNGPANNVVVTEILPANTTFVGPTYWTQVNANTYVYTIPLLSPSSGGNLDFRVRVANPFPAGTSGVTNTVQIASGSASECDVSNNISLEFTRIDQVPSGSFSIYLPIILKSDQTPTPTPPPPPTTPTPTPTPTPLAYVSDVKADPDTNQIFIASPRHDWVYVINGSSDTLARNVPVGHGPTGLTVLKGSSPANNKVFVAHQYGANFWRPGFMAFGVNDVSAHNTADTGYAGAAPIKTAANATNNSRVYVSNYFDKLAVFNGNSGPPEARLGWVVQKAFQGAYGTDVSTATHRVYLATRDTGELVVFDGNGDRLLQSNYIPTHVKPPQACSLWSVAVNETTGHVFVPCPQLGKVYVLQENQISVLDLETLGVLEERDGNLALVVSPQVAPWIAEVTVPGGVGLGEEGIAVNTSTGRVFITNAQNNTLVVLQDGGSPAYVTTVGVGTRPQGVDVNPVTQKVYVGNTGSNNVTVLNANSPFTVTKIIPLTP